VQQEQTKPNFTLAAQKNQTIRKQNVKHGIAKGKQGVTMQTLKTDNEQLIE
jgi:hypothetical protein